MKKATRHKSAGRRLAREKRTVELMIRLYCRRKEGNTALCSSCAELLAYAHARLDRCPFGNNKPVCKHCRVHCYKPAMRERVRRVMRWAGPRMILFHPVEAVRHLLGKG